MPISTWIRDIFGIRKDLIETQRSKLEVKKLEDDELARNLITPATMDDIKEYDPLYRRVRKAKKRRGGGGGHGGYENAGCVVILVVLLLILALITLICFLLYKYFRNNW